MKSSQLWEGGGDEISALESLPASPAGPQSQESLTRCHSAAERPWVNAEHLGGWKSTGFVVKLLVSSPSLATYLALA